MEKQPEEETVLAMENDSVDFELKFTDETPETSPSFFLDGELQPTIGFSGDFSVSVVQGNDEANTDIEWVISIVQL